jgi:hypothetical protein
MAQAADWVPAGVDPGLVNVPLWRPGAPADVPADPAGSGSWPRRR